MMRIQKLDTVSSTNILVKQAIDAREPEGLVVCARCQTGGYGRQGRVWQSPRGGLYFSLLLRPVVPSCQLPTLPLVAGLALRQALVRLAGAQAAPSVQVKWPNDIVLADRGTAFRKLCGISCEAHRGAVCLGVGVNVLRTPAGRMGLREEAAADAAADVKNVPAYLVDLIDDQAAEDSDLFAVVLQTALAEFELRYKRWQAKGFGVFAAEYATCDALRGKQVAIADRTGALIIAGEADGITDNGCLLVRTADGAITPFSSGEAHIQ